MKADVQRPLPNLDEEGLPTRKYLYISTVVCETKHSNECCRMIYINAVTLW